MMLKWRKSPWRKSPLLPPLQLKPQGPSSDAPSPDMAHLWEETNKALVDLLAIKSSIDTHQQKLISEFSMALCQNNSKTMESIKGRKGHLCHSIQEAKDSCSVAIREAEAQRVPQAISLQQSHHKVNPSSMGTWMEELRRIWYPSHHPIGDSPCPTSENSDEGSDRGTATHQPNTSPSHQSSHTWIRLLLFCKSKAIYDACQRCGMLTRLHLLKIRLIKSYTY